jgi:hypothetical protein
VDCLQFKLIQDIIAVYCEMKIIYNFLFKVTVINPKLFIPKLVCRSTSSFRSVNLIVRINMKSYPLFVNELVFMETWINESVDHSLQFSAELMSEAVPPLPQRLRRFNHSQGQLLPGIVIPHTIQSCWTNCRSFGNGFWKV